MTEGAEGFGKTVPGQEGACWYTDGHSPVQGKGGHWQDSPAGAGGGTQGLTWQSIVDLGIGDRMQRSPQDTQGSKPPTTASNQEPACGCKVLWAQGLAHL